MSQVSSVRNIIIVGSGPAGLTAAIYAARGNLSPLIIEGYQSGGQLMLTSEVENFPGFAHGIMGPELMKQMRDQATRFGAEFISADATKVELNGSVKKVWVEDQVYEARTVIVSTGATAKLLGLESERKLMGRGVSTCATCDGFFFKDKVIAVVGGGDSAMEEAHFLTRYASKVYLIHRREDFRASKIMVDRAKNNPKIQFVLNSGVEEILGANEVEGVRIKNLINNEVTTLNLSAVFVAIGHRPTTALFEGQLKLDDQGYLITSSEKSHVSSTNIEGVFACGDVQDKRYRQAITAAGSGCAAALDAEHYLSQ
jgi:thioredoxin reductase (NADPH)